MPPAALRGLSEGPSGSRFLKKAPQKLLLKKQTYEGIYKEGYSLSNPKMKQSKKHINPNNMG